MKLKYTTPENSPVEGLVLPNFSPELSTTALLGKPYCIISQMPY